MIASCIDVPALIEGKSRLGKGKVRSISDLARTDGIFKRCRDILREFAAREGDIEAAGKVFEFRTEFGAGLFAPHAILARAYRALNVFDQCVCICLFFQCLNP